MGNAHCLVMNKTHKRMCVLTFNYADLLYTKYTNMYIINPGESVTVEALPHDWGLKVAIVYDASAESQSLMYQMWKCKNESVLTVTFMNQGDISTFGDNTTAMQKSEVSERDDEAFQKAIDALTYQSPVTRSVYKR